MTTENNSLESAKDAQKPSEFLFNLLFNILLPVLLLTKLPKWIDNENAAAIALVSALSFPVGYFIWDFVKTRKSNFISIIGFVSVLLTGGIGLLQLPNEWLAIKEASVPALIMIILLVALALGHPLVGELLYREQVFDKVRINSALEAKGKVGVVDDIMKKSTLIVAFSFLVSTILNYVLASTIVVSDPITQAEQRTEEIGRLTGLSYLVIALPCTLIMCVAIYYIFRRLSKETGLTTEEMMAESLREKNEELKDKN